MSIYYRLDDLVNSPNLPTVANIHVCVSQSPFKSDEGGGKWLMDVRSPSGNSTAIVSILINPQMTGLVDLGYKSTSKQLLEIFDDKKNWAMFQKEEELLIQAFPKHGIRNGENVLYLNVPTVVIVRPNLLFGRTIIDFASKCERRTYLSIAKAVRQHGKHPTGYSSSIVGGKLGHDLVSAYAVENLANKSQLDTQLLDHISDETLTSLVWLGLCSDSNSDISVAWNRGIKSLRTVQNSKKINDLFFKDDENWVSESDSLNNGVSASPDLMASKHIVELKQVDVNSEFYNEKKLMRQLEGYLAWAMVEFGVENVCENWTGVLLNIHEKTPEDQRLVKLKPEPEFLGWRILNRHKQLGSITGRWLPSPNEGECEFCEFANPTSGMEHLPAPCTYYCQTERHWSCIDGTRKCPLLGSCNQNDKYENYERLDAFNRFRQEMLEEEGEQETIREIVGMMSKASESNFTLFTGFKLVKQIGTRVHLVIPKEISNLIFANFGDRFTALDNKSTEIGKWTFIKRKREKEDKLIFETGCYKPLNNKILFSLRPEPGERIQIRDQLASLDIDQRNGDVAFSLRNGKTRPTELQVRKWKNIQDLPGDVQFVLVNTFEHKTAKDVINDLLNDLLKTHFNKSKVLIISDDIKDIKLDNSTSNLASYSLRENIHNQSDLINGLTELINIFRKSNIIVTGFEELLKENISRLIEKKGKFDAIIILGAEKIPLLTVGRCIAFGKSVFLVGNRESMGPRVESANGQGSVLGLNPIRYIADVGPSILPESILNLDIVNIPITKAPFGLKNFPNFCNSISMDIPVNINMIDATENNSLGYIYLSGHAANLNSRSITLELDMTGQKKIPMRLARQIMKSLNPLVIEKLSQDITNKLDSSILGYTARVTKRELLNSPDPHTVILKLPVEEFNYVEEMHLASKNEVFAVIAKAKEIGFAEEFVACSPFLGQCLLLSTTASSEGLQLPVFTPSTLVTQHFNQNSTPVLLLSLVATGKIGETRIPFPLNDPRSILPLLGGPWKRIEIFCSAYLEEYYPLIRLLQQQISSLTTKTLIDEKE